MKLGDRTARGARAMGFALAVSLLAAGPAAATTDVLKLAMAYGTAIASYNVEEFGTERVARLTGPEIVERVHELQRITSFEVPEVALKA